MLVRLSVEDFALFERCDMELSPGLNALTGETGAGKSLLLDALDCILGGRASADLVRRGSDEAVVEAFFVIANPSIASAVSALVGRELDGGEILLRRRISRSGRSTAEVNGHSVPIGVLKQAGDLLVDIHGQNEHQRLIQPSVQLDTLDAFAGLAGQRAVCRGAYGQLRDSVGLARATEAERENLQRDIFGVVEHRLDNHIHVVQGAWVASGEQLGHRWSTPTCPRRSTVVCACHDVSMAPGDGLRSFFAQPCDTRHDHDVAASHGPEHLGDGCPDSPDSAGGVGVHHRRDPLVTVLENSALHPDTRVEHH